MRLVAVCAFLACAVPGAAQDVQPSGRTIQVMGSGRVSSMPTIAVIDYWMTGEGKTPDDATTALVARQKAIVDGVGGLLGGTAAMTNSNLVVIAARGPQCDHANGYNAQPRLSEGPCAITGYLATMQGSIRTPLVAKAGTAAGLASRLGARDARVQNFILSDGGAAKRAAVVEAVAEAKRLAGALAAAAGEKLGPILAIRDQNYNPAEDMTVVAMSAPAPPPAPRAPVEIQVKPGPIETNAQVYLTFALAP